MSTTKGTHMNTHTLTTTTGETVAAISQTEWQQSIERRDANRKTHRSGADRNPECKMCGRKMSTKAAENATHIHMTVDLDIVPVSADMGSNSQGFFPVGSECAKQLPAAYKTKRGA
jgi:hypothetical protein